MYTELLGTYRGCKKGESMEGTTDFLLSGGKLGKALHLFRKRLRNKSARINFATTVLTGIPQIRRNRKKKRLQIQALRDRKMAEQQ